MEGRVLLLKSALSSRLRSQRSITELLVLSDATQVEQQNPNPFASDNKGRAINPAFSSLNHYGESFNLLDV
jgi:hypothetical protein